jgi:hypothetical protein
MAKIAKVLPIGVSNAFYGPLVVAVTVWHPIPDAKNPGTLVNLSAIDPFQNLPPHFFLGDGGFSRAVMEIDQRPGKPLDAMLNGFVARIEKYLADAPGKSSRKDVLHYLQHRLATLVDERWSRGSDRKSDNPWDPTAPPSKTSWDIYKEAGRNPESRNHWPTPFSLPVVPFDSFLTEKCAAYCMQKALLARLLLDRFHFPSRFIAGSVVEKDKENPGRLIFFGHSWLEVPDLKDESKWVVFDPTHKIHQAKGAPHPQDVRWYSFNGAYRFSNELTPILVPKE